MNSPDPETERPGHSSHCHCCACFPQGGIQRQPLLSLCDVSLRRENRLILSDVNFTADRGDFIAITGPNGGGKTTLLRLILGLLAPSQGRIIYYGTDGSPSAASPRFGYLPQKNSVDSHFPITVGEVVASGLLGTKGLSDSERRARVSEVLSMIEMSAYERQPIGKLSGGQLQRALFGRAIVSRPGILVLDEPLSYIDKHFEKHLYRIIADMAPHSTILLVSHEMSQISAMANRHVIVDHTLHECTAAHHYLKPECE